MKILFVMLSFGLLALFSGCAADLEDRRNEYKYGTVVEVANDTLIIEAEGQRWYIEINLMSDANIRFTYPVGQRVRFVYRFYSEDRGLRPTLFDRHNSATLHYGWVKPMKN